MVLNRSDSTKRMAAHASEKAPNVSVSRAVATLRTHSSDARAAPAARTVEEVGLAGAIGAHCARASHTSAAGATRSPSKHDRRFLRVCGRTAPQAPRTEGVELGAEGLGDDLLLIALEALHDDLRRTHTRARTQCQWPRRLAARVVRTHVRGRACLMCILTPGAGAQPPRAWQPWRRRAGAERRRGRCAVQVQTRRWPALRAGLPEIVGAAQDADEARTKLLLVCGHCACVSCDARVAACCCALVGAPRSALASFPFLVRDSSDKLSGSGLIRIERVMIVLCGLAPGCGNITCGLVTSWSSGRLILSISPSPPPAMIE
jgi:hypothetical protein